jgi:hypothetical protein
VPISGSLGIKPGTRLVRAWGGKVHTVTAVPGGYAWFDDLVTGRANSVSEIAAREGLTPRYVSRLLDLAFLPPTLVEAILEGRQPADMTAEQLSKAERGLVWSDM